MTVDLISVTDEERKKVRTNSFDLSFNELIDMYRDEELVISPEYQRLFRWKPEDQSRFIESLVLELPVPPIFVIEKSDGVYEVIDGLQRISSYLNFRGLIKGKEKLKLTGCDILQELNGLTFEDLPKVIQIRLKRNFVRLEVIRKESAPELRYHMFKRLNRGGEVLSEQEVRNCTVRILDDKFIEFIIELSKNEDFKNTISKLTDDEIERKKDQELVLRYFSLKNNVENYNGDLEEFLTQYMEDVTEEKLSFNYESEKEIFEKTFKLLNELEGSDIFSTVLNSGKIRDNLVVYLFDSFTLGVENIIDSITTDKVDMARKKLKDLKLKDGSEGGKLYSKRTGSKSNTIHKKQIVENYITEGI